MTTRHCPLDLPQKVEDELEALAAAREILET
jgi:hypothetical protein